MMKGNVVAGMTAAVRRASHQVAAVSSRRSKPALVFGSSRLRAVGGVVVLGARYRPRSFDP